MPDGCYRIDIPEGTSKVWLSVNRGIVFPADRCSKGGTMVECPGRLLAVGDIHGYYDKLEALMNEVRPTAVDKVIFLGDYIDRGPDSCKVLQYLMDFKKRFPGTDTVFLRGNHEQMLLDALAESRDMGPSFSRLRDISAKAKADLDSDAWWIFTANGGRKTLESYGASTGSAGNCTAIPDEHVDFLQKNLFHHQEIVEVTTQNGTAVQTFLFVHAGITPGVPLEKQDPMDLLWIREPFLHSKSRFGGKIVVHGHTPNLEVPTRSAHRICVDSGVYLYGSRYSGKAWGKLTCCNVLTREIWQAG